MLEVIVVCLTVVACVGLVCGVACKWIDAWSVAHEPRSLVEMLTNRRRHTDCEEEYE